MKTISHLMTWMTNVKNKLKIAASDRFVILLRKIILCPANQFHGFQVTFAERLGK